MGLSQVAIGNTLGAHIGNLMGTCWEQRKNEWKLNHGQTKKNEMLLRTSWKAQLKTWGTFWEQTTKQKKLPPSCPLAKQLADLQFFVYLLPL
jgi:hypothetical protein